MSYSISEASRMSGLNPRTIRFYEEAGVLPSPSRSESGQRRYSADDVRKLLLASRARRLGLALPEVRMLVGSTYESTCADYASLTADTLRAQQVKADETIRELKALRREIGALISEADQAAAMAPSGLRVSDCAHCLLMDPSDASPGACCQPSAPISDEDLALLGCEIDRRPPGEPGPDELQAFYLGSRRTADGLRFVFEANGSEMVERFAAAERMCCPGLGWRVTSEEGSVGLEVSATPEQVARLSNRLFGMDPVS